LQNVPDRSTYYIIYLKKIVVADPKGGLWRTSPPPKYATVREHA
jgi:hypothetical protein